MMRVLSKLYVMNEMFFHLNNSVRRERENGTKLVRLEGVPGTPIWRLK